MDLFRFNIWVHMPWPLKLSLITYCLFILMIAKYFQKQTAYKVQKDCICRYFLSTPIRENFVLLWVQKNPTHCGSLLVWDTLNLDRGPHGLSFQKDRRIDSSLHKKPWYYWKGHHKLDCYHLQIGSENIP